MAERVSFRTIDDVTIVGDWMAAPTTLGVVILIHMMPATRGSWASFQSVLAKKGLASLAIDLRGHGESTEGPDGIRLDYQAFTPEEHQTSLLDVEAAITWLRKRGFELRQIALCGASIGANFAAETIANETATAGAVLLSPGRNYHGTNVIESVERIAPEQGLCLIASDGDDGQSFSAAKEAYDTSSSLKKEFVPYKNGGHGTAILEKDPALMERLAAWLLEIIHSR